MMNPEEMAPMMEQAEKPTPTAAAGDRVPLSALNMPDEAEQMQAPEVGDKVQYTIEGTVKAIDGNFAIIERETINGEPANSEEANETPEEEAAEQAAGQGGQDGADNLQDLEELARNTQLS